MQRKVSKGEPVMDWIYAGPYVLDVSDIYPDNYVIPFEDYSDMWNEAVQCMEQTGKVREGQECELFGQNKQWRYLQYHEADRKIVWAKFGVSATLMVNVLKTFVKAEHCGMRKIHFQLCGAARVLVNGEKILEHCDVGRVSSEHTAEMFFRDGWNEVNVMLMNVHLHCQNVLQMTIDDEVTTELPLFPIAEQKRMEMENGLKSVYLSHNILHEGEQLFLCSDKTPEDITYLYSVEEEKQKVLKSGETAGKSFRQALLKAEDLTHTGQYVVKLNCRAEGITIQGPELHFKYFKFFKEVPRDGISERKQFILKAFAGSGEPLPPMSAIFRQIARLYLGMPVEEDEVNRTIDYINARYDCSDFALHGLLRFYFRCRSHRDVSAALLERIKECVLNFKYWVDEPGKSMTFTRSENHEFLFYSVEYLAGLAFPTDIFTNSGQNGLFHSLKGRINAQHWICEKGHYGFTEWHSNTYYEEDLLGLLNLYDFAEENGLLRALAWQLIDLIVIFIASNNKDGIMATTHGRCYETSLMYPETEGMSRINYVLFGKPEKISTEMSIGAISLSDSRYMPDEDLTEIAFINPLETDSRMGLFRNSRQYGVKCTTYRTEHYMVSGLIESKAGEFGAQVNAGQALLEDGVPVFVTCFADRSPVTRPSYFGGQFRVPKTITCRNVIAYIFDIKDNQGYTHCYFPQERFDRTERKDKWIFGCRGDAYIAVYCSGYWTQTVGGEYDKCELLSLDKRVIWFFELGDKEKYGSFECFTEKILQSRLAQDDNALTYQSPSLGELIFSWNGACTLEGRQIAERESLLISNSEVRSSYGSGIVETKFGKVYDFFA